MWKYQLRQTRSCVYGRYFLVTPKILFAGKQRSIEINSRGTKYVHLHGALGAKVGLHKSLKALGCSTIHGKSLILANDIGVGVNYLSHAAKFPENNKLHGKWNSRNNPFVCVRKRTKITLTKKKKCRFDTLECKRS